MKTSLHGKKAKMYVVTAKEFNDRMEYIDFLKLLDKKREEGLDTTGYSHTDLIWLGYKMANSLAKTGR
jgi:hypothetical protein